LTKRHMRAIRRLRQLLDEPEEIGDHGDTDRPRSGQH
jgi:hypothetical protein